MGPDLLWELAMLATTVSLGGVGESTAMPQISVVVSADAVAGGPDTRARQVDFAPAPLIPVPFADSARESAGAAPTAMLGRLAALPRERLESFVAQNPQLVAHLLLRPPTARDVSSWWAGLDTSARFDLMAAAPQLVGNLDGIDLSVRDMANRRFLSQQIAALEAQLDSGVGRGVAVAVDGTLHMLEEIAKALRTDAGEPPRTLVTLDTQWPGRAAIAVGDVTTADYVSFLIPGMFFTIDGQVGDWADTATVVYEEQNRWLDRLEGKTDQGRSTVATVAWIGYQTPHLLNIGSLSLAEEGAIFLANALEGLQSIREGDQPHVAVLAHSYGSTAAMIALQDSGFQVDALAMVGSPGSAAQSAADLAVRGGKIFVGEASGDPVVNTAFYGSDPGAPGYGAKSMSVAGGVDAITRAMLTGSHGHNEYFTPGSESVRNLALIGIDRADLVSVGGDPGEKAGKLLLASR